MPRKDLTLSSKIELLDKIKSRPPNTSHRQLAELTGVPKSTLSRLLQQENELRDEWALYEGKPGTSKRKREGKNPEVEEVLDQWFSLVTERGASVSGPILKAKSEEFAKRLGHNDFRATDGWLSRWKARHNIKFKKVHGKVGGTHWKNTVFLESFSADDIYIADETGLYYCATPDGSLCYKHAALSGYRKAMDRITILCCANVAGTDKRKLLVIGKSSKPRCFKGLRMESLPVEYHANKNAWITSDIFRNWLMNWNIELQHQQRKILLRVANCSAHPNLSNLQNIKLEFLSRDTTSILQSMGIIKNLKIFYRQKLVNFILQSIEENLLTSSSTAREISAKINILQAIQFVADSWRAIKIDTIKNCFAVSGFRAPQIMDSGVQNDEFILQVPVVNVEEFLTIDNNLQCFDENEDFETTIVENLKAKQQKLVKDDSDDDIPLVPVTNREAAKFIAGLQQYFMQEGNEGSPLSALNICADFVQLKNTIKKETAFLQD